MLICVAHWTTLREAIQDAGLAQFVEKPDWSQPECTELTLARYEAQNGRYDPLSYCVHLIMVNATELLGVEFMSSTEALDLCPICEVLRLAEETWTAGIVDAAKQAAEEQGLLRHDDNGQDPEEDNPPP